MSQLPRRVPVEDGSIVPPVGGHSSVDRKLGKYWMTRCWRKVGGDEQRPLFLNSRWLALYPFFPSHFREQHVLAPS